MKKLVLFAAVAGLGLVSASPPGHPPHHPREARAGYPPCSRTVTDSCIQLRERGVRTRQNLARNQAVPGTTQTAQAGSAAGCRRCAPPRRHLSRRVRQAGERG